MIVQSEADEERFVFTIPMQLSRAELEHLAAFAIENTREKHGLSRRAVPPKELAELAREEIRAVDRKAEILGPKLFADPAWRIMLDLLIQRVGRKETSVSSACIASGGPSTSALRYLQAMIELGLIERTEDPQDRRRVFVALTEKGYAAVKRLLLSR